MTDVDGNLNFDSMSNEINEKNKNRNIVNAVCCFFFASNEITLLFTLNY